MRKTTWTLHTGMLRHTPPFCHQCVVTELKTGVSVSVSMRKEPEKIILFAFVKYSFIPYEPCCPT